MKKSSTSTSPTPNFRAWLATLSDDALTRLLQLRRDVVLPLPPGIGSLAARLQLRASIRRAIGELNTTELLVLEALEAAGGGATPVTAPDVYALIAQRCTGAELTPPTEPDIQTALERLRDMGLAFDPTPGEYAALPEVLSALPAHLTLLPEEGENTQRTREELTQALAELPVRKRKVLDTLKNSGGLGITKDAAVDADPERPIPQLIAAGLLHRVDANTVRLPRDVRALLQGTVPVPLTSPSITASTFGAAQDSAGVAAGLEVIRQLRVLLTVLGTAPASTLKGGGVGVRALGKLAKLTDLAPEDIQRLLCLAEAAGLIARGVPDPLPQDDDGGDYYAPTPLAYDWLNSSLGHRWAVLLDGWAGSAWLPHLIGMRDDKGSTIHALSPASHENSWVEKRRWLIQLWTEFGELSAQDAVAQLRFTRPLSAITEADVTHLTQEARWVGALTSVLQGTDPESLMPAPTTQLIVQGDMTVMTGGPLTPEVQQLMDAVGELESSGLASVYRLTETSVRRALDRGLTGTAILDSLASFSVTPIPQAVTFLVEDVARRHGSLRGGPALSYLRCEDPSMLVQAIALVGEKVAMRAVAPTVAIAQAPLIEVIRQLRDAGLQPVAEDAFGMTLDLREEPSRVPTPTRAQPPAQLDESRIAAAVAAIRRNDATGIKPGKPVGDTIDPALTLAALKDAATAGRSVTLGFVDRHGVAVHRVVRPVSVSAGVVDCIDPATGSAHRFQLHRITEVLV